jgi:hypothetical protein
MRGASMLRLATGVGSRMLYPIGPYRHRQPERAAMLSRSGFSNRPRRHCASLRASTGTSASARRLIAGTGLAATPLAEIALLTCTGCAELAGFAL